MRCFGDVERASRERFLGKKTGAENAGNGQGPGAGSREPVRLLVRKNGSGRSGSGLYRNPRLIHSTPFPALMMMSRYQPLQRSD